MKPHEIRVRSLGISKLNIAQLFDTSFLELSDTFTVNNNNWWLDLSSSFSVLISE